MRRKVLFSIIMLIISSLLFGSTISFAMNDSAAEIALASTAVYGDVNGDRNVDSIDYALVKSYLLNVIAVFPAENGFMTADVSGDGNVNSLDLSLIRQYILRTIEIFPVENLIGEWVPYMPKKEDIHYHIGQNSDGKYQVVFEVTFPATGYMVEYTDELAIALAIQPDGTILTSYRPVKEPTFWAYTGPSLAVITTKQLVYTLGGKGKYTFEFLRTWYDFDIQ